MEGVPARNLFPTGNDLGFRRPGFAISAEPGIQYARRGNVLTLTIARAIYRDRTRSVPDILTDGHGDAAFANCVWLASYSFRAGGKHGEEPSSQQPAVPRPMELPPLRPPPGPPRAQIRVPANERPDSRLAENQFLAEAQRTQREPKNVVLRGLCVSVRNALILSLR
jgi:hypothetical protein